MSPQLKKALISILIGAGVLALNNILTELIKLLQAHLPAVIPAAVSSFHFLTSGKENLPA